MPDPRPDPESLGAALDLLLDRPGLRREERLTILTGAVTALGHEPTLDAFFGRALLEAPIPDLREIVLQTYLFAGYPRAINGLFALRAGALAAGRDPDDGLVEGPLSPAHAQSRGESVCATVYGKNYARLRANIRALHPDLDRWMVEEGYGKVLGRPTLGLRVRELAAVSALVVLDVPRQVRAHLTGSRQAGASTEDLRETLAGVALFASPQAMERARALS